MATDHPWYGSNARILALFAEKVRSRPCEKLPETQGELNALVARRRQLVQMKASEQVRLHQVRTREVRRSVSHMLDQLRKQVDAIDAQIARLIDDDEGWKRRGWGGGAESRVICARFEPSANGACACTLLLFRSAPREVADSKS
jgi:hypothetical protein